MGIDFSNIGVRPVLSEEEPRWRSLMGEHHYLGFKRVFGERVSYVAEYKGEWVALLSWAAAALKIQPREDWIGWIPEHKSERLKFIANNWRFLVLPQWRIPNLASHILSKNLHRLSVDWEQKYAHPILMVETFVDPSRYRGTCYKADNWICIGQTSGFEKIRQGYVYHGEKKLIFIKPLTKRARKTLGSQWTHPIFLPPSNRGRVLMDVDKITLFGRNGFFEFCKNLRDGRSKHGKRYPLPGLMVVCILAMLAGAKGYKGIYIWTTKLSPKMLARLKLWRPPSQSTIRRFLMKLDAEHVDQELSRWFASQGSLKSKALALDGKTLRGSHDGDKNAIQLLSVVIHDTAAIVAQAEVSSKTNEIPVAQALLKELDIEGAVITADALHTQDKTAAIIVRDKKADYVFTVKDNQKALKNQITQALQQTSAFPP